MLGGSICADCDSPAIFFANIIEAEVGKLFFKLKLSGLK
jgi:hypothetical protein